MLVTDISKLYFKLGFIQEINQNVYLSYTNMIKKWSGGFPLFAGRFYSDCVFGEDIAGMQVLIGKTTPPIAINDLVYKDKVYKEAEIYPSVDNIILNIKYGSNTLKIIAFLFGGEFKLGDGEVEGNIHLFGGAYMYYYKYNCNQINLEFPIGKKSLINKLHIAGDECVLVTDGIQEIIKVDNISDLKKYMQMATCIFPPEMPGRLDSEYINCCKKMHIICASAFEYIARNEVYLELPSDIWSLDAEQSIMDIGFGVPDELNLECLRSYTASSSNIDKIISYAKRIYRCYDSIVVNPHNLVEFRFNRAIYMSINSIDMLNCVIYNFGDSDIVIHESALYSHSDKCRAVFKVKNNNTLKSLIKALRNVRENILNNWCTTRLDSNIALVIVPDEIDIDKIRTGYVRIEHESVYNSWGYESLDGEKYWAAIIKKLELK